MQEHSDFLDKVALKNGSPKKMIHRPVPNFDFKILVNGILFVSSLKF